MNNYTKLLIALSAAAALFATACEDKAKTTPPAETAKPATPVVPAATVASLELSDDDVPVPEDFIEEATKEIDDKNLSAKLDEIEKLGVGHGVNLV